MAKAGRSDEEQFHQRVKGWRVLTPGLLLELYTLRKAIDSVNQAYFQGQHTLFPASSEGFDQLVAFVDKLVGLYNEGLAAGIEQLE